MNLHDTLMQALNKSIINTFETTLSISLEETKIELPTADESIICSIGLAGNISGMISMCVSKKSAALIVSKMLGMEIDAGSSDANDGIREILNIIAGGVKSNASENDIKFDISLPTTVVGNNLAISLFDDLHHIKNVFKFDDVGFIVMFTYKIQPHQNDAAQKEINSSALSAMKRLKDTIEQNKAK
jgi:chemotaxis protein CheX